MLAPSMNSLFMGETFSHTLEILSGLEERLVRIDIQDPNE